MMNNVIELHSATSTSEYLGEALTFAPLSGEVEKSIEWNLALNVEVLEPEPDVLLSDEEQMSLYRALMASVRFIDL